MLRRRVRTATSWLLLVMLYGIAVWMHHGLIDGAWSHRLSRFGNDYASFHYAVKAAVAGDDPYDVAALAAAAREEGIRNSAHPFFYPPPALLLMRWTTAFDVTTAYRRWFWVQELAVLCAVFVLLAWWRPLGRGVGIALFAALATLTALPDNLFMGQVNLPVVAITLIGLAVADRGRPGLGGAIVAVACMAKMAPALFVLDALVRRRWRFVGGAALGAIALSAAAIGAFGVETTRRFYVEVFPGFASGDYNGLRVPITLFGNHGLPSVWIEWFPAAERPWRELSEMASRGARWTSLAVVAITAVSSWRAGSDRASVAARVGAISVLMILVPLYTYEHHLVWGIPAVAAIGGLIGVGRLPRWSLVLLLPAFWVWGVDLPWLDGTYRSVSPGRPWVGWVLKEGKTLGLVTFWALCIAALWTRPRSEVPR